MNTPSWKFSYDNETFKVYHNNLFQYEIELRLDEFSYFKKLITRRIHTDRHKFKNITISIFFQLVYFDTPTGDYRFCLTEGIRKIRKYLWNPYDDYRALYSYKLDSKELKCVIFSGHIAIKFLQFDFSEEDYRAFQELYLALTTGNLFIHPKFQTHITADKITICGFDYGYRNNKRNLQGALHDVKKILKEYSSKVQIINSKFDVLIRTSFEYKSFTFKQTDKIRNSYTLVFHLEGSSFTSLSFIPMGNLELYILDVDTKDGIYYFKDRTYLNIFV